MNAQVLNQYLATGTIPEKEAVDTQDAALIIVAKRQESDPVFRLMAQMCAVEMVAKDLHYRAKGKPFYGIHELADLVFKVGESVDDLNEVYYLGEKETVPPYKAQVARAAVDSIDYLGDSDMIEEELLMRELHTKCMSVDALVSEAKKVVESAGAGAILDEISKTALQAAGLLGRTLAGDERQNVGMVVSGDEVG